VKKGSKTASKIGAIGMAVCFVAASTGNAWAACAAPQEMTALRAAALRQHLMVAGLVCHDAASFNQFITAYQSEYQESDRALMAFFNRHGSGDAGYNAYKTHEANDSSLRSIHDPNFCQEAEAAFYIALHRGLALAQLATYEAPILRTGYQSCSRSAELYDASYATPAMPARHEDVMESTTASEAAPPPAAVAAAPAAAPGEDDSATEDDSAPGETPQQTADNSYGYAGSNAGYSYNYRPYPLAPAVMRQVQGPDGGWYLVPSYVW